VQSTAHRTPYFRLALAISLAVSALLFFVWSWRWPLVGDASLMHYIAFLTGRGWAPYRDLGDMNMPGSYMVEIAAMRVFGMGALAWRLFDFTQLAIASAAFFVIAWPHPVGAGSLASSASGISGRAGSKLAGLFAASLFILVHGRDGLAQGGQRDLTMAVCLIAAAACLMLVLRRAATTDAAAPKAVPWLAAAFGLLSGVAVSIKPSVLPLSLAQLVLAVFALGAPGARSGNPRQQGAVCATLLRCAVPAALAWLLVQAAVVAFLLREHALAAFLAGLHTIVPYYASLGHRPLGYILLHSISPLLPLVLIWLALLPLGSPQWWRDWERNILLAGVLFGLINCIVQARALPYYRYPLLAFLLPLMALDFTRALSIPRAAPQPIPLRTRAAQALAVIALSVGGFFLAPQSAILIHRYRWWQTDFLTSLERNLDQLGGPALSGHIQCIDTNRGCGNVLYNLRLEPATGMLSDFLIFGSSDAAAVRETRAQFSQAIMAKPPQVIVVTSPLYLGTLDDYRKLDRWPAFASYLADRYTLRTQWSPTRTERWWSREEAPAGYRIYVLRGNSAIEDQIWGK